MVGLKRSERRSVARDATAMAAAEPPPLTDRQRRELEYHRSHAARLNVAAGQPVGLDVVTNARRRWWNAYWHTYTLLRKHDLSGKRVLVPGCGVGADAIRIASLGARVCAFDLSPELIEIARRRCRNLGVRNVDLAVMPSETLSFDKDDFDMVFFIDILHHVDIPATMKEVRRVVRRGGRIIGNELYTHGYLQKNIRESNFVKNALYPRMVKYIYGTSKPYITEDEHKIDEDEFGILTAMCSDIRISYFNMLVGRFVPDRWDSVAMVDRGLSAGLGGLARFVAGRVVFDGSLQKS